MKKVLFHRNFKKFTGGHLKVWHYFNHTLSSPDFNPFIYFSKESLWDESNPWKDSQPHIVESRETIDPDIYFLAGRDWVILNQNQRSNSSIPIINLIQGLRHTLPNHILYDFLKNRAIRICVSQEVGDLLQETKQTNGPIYVIPNCLELKKIPRALDYAEKEIDLLIFSKKNRRLGQNIYNLIDRPHLSIHVIDKHLPREEFLSFVNKSKTTLFLPLYPFEGFFLPALEGMALESLVICPDCVGNRSFCIPEYNCFRPEFNLNSILHDIDKALNINVIDRLKLIGNASKTVSKHDITVERMSFHNILNDIFQIW